MLKILFFIVFLCATLASNNICFAESDELHATAILGLTGPAATHAKAIQDGIEFAKLELIRDGWKVDVKYQDDQTDSKKTVSAMNAALAFGHKVFIGPTWSFQVNAVKKILEGKKAFAIVPAGTSDTNGGSSPSTINLTPSLDRMSAPLGNWLQAETAVINCILTPNGDWGERHRTIFKKALKSTQQDISLDEVFDYGIDSATLRSILTKMKARSCGRIFITGGSGDMALIVKSRNEVAPEMQIIGTEGLNDAIIEKLIDASVIRNNDSYIAISGDNDFSKQYLEKFGILPHSFTVRGYYALLLLAHRFNGKQCVDLESCNLLFSAHSQIKLHGKEIAFDQNGDIVQGEYEVKPLH